MWYYAGKAIPDDCSEIYYDYCNYPVDDGRIIGKASKIKFIHFRFNIQLRKKNNSRTTDQIKKDIFSQINSYRKKHGISKKMV